MRQNEARATKTWTGISLRGSIRFRIRSDVPGTAKTADADDLTPVGDWLVCQMKMKMAHSW